MSATTSLFGDQSPHRGSRRNSPRWMRTKLLRLAIEDLYPGRIALVSSFGADSAVLLHMVSADRQGDAGGLRRHRPAVPETLAYRDDLVTRSWPDQRHRDPPRPDPRRSPSDPETFSRAAIRTAAATSARSGPSPRRWKAMTPGSPGARVSRRRDARPCRCSKPKASGSKSTRSPAGARATC